jgi:hypothetical protein
MSGLLMRLVDRWPRWFPRREFQTTKRPFFGQWVPRIFSHLGSIDPYHLSPFAAPAQPVGELIRPVDLLGGEC